MGLNQSQISFCDNSVCISGWLQPDDDILKLFDYAWLFSSPQDGYIDFNVQLKTYQECHCVLGHEICWTIWNQFTPQQTLLILNILINAKSLQEHLHEIQIFHNNNSLVIFYYDQYGYMITSGIIPKHELKPHNLLNKEIESTIII